MSALWDTHVRAGDAEDEEKHSTSVDGFDFGHVIVGEEHWIGVRLQVLLLARENTLREGDLDNRLKTLSDSLAVPPNPQQARHTVSNGKGKTICLMRDARQVKSISVDRREWLEPGEGEHYSDVQVVVTASTFAVGPVTLAGIAWIG